MNAEKLNAYRKTLERRMWLFRIAWLAYLLLMVAQRFLGPTFEEGLLYGMVTGALTGGLLVAALSMFRFHRAMKDDRQLLRLYNQEHDERLRAIRAKVGMPVVAIYGMVLLAAGMVATFFSITVAVTLMAVAVAQLLASCALKFWYMRRM